MKTVVLLRHGESTWNRDNRFTGWIDAGLSDSGVQEAIVAGKALAAGGYAFDVAYTSVLKRAIKTLWIVWKKWISCGFPFIEAGGSTSGTTALFRVSTKQRQQKSSARNKF